MKLNWINSKDYTMKTFLYFDRWIIQLIMDENMEYEFGSKNYLRDMSLALVDYPYVLDYCKTLCPNNSFIKKLLNIIPTNSSFEEKREAENNIIQALEVFVVYAYPNVMDNLNYIRNWDENNLFRLADFENKTVLDIGSGTGRLAFAAAKKAKLVIASEPSSMLRNYIKDKAASLSLNNIKVADGDVLDLPFVDNSFDIVMSGYVMGDNFRDELKEITRVIKNNGMVISCCGDDEYIRTKPSDNFIKNEFDVFKHTSIEGGIIYDYRKQILKN